MGSVKAKIMSLFKANTTGNYSKPKCAKIVYGGCKKTRRQYIYYIHM